MRFYGRQEGMTNAILSCRSPYEILRRRSKSKNPSLSCCRSPYEILQGRARLVISLFLLPFSLWDSEWWVFGSWTCKVITQPQCCRSPYEIHSNLNRSFRFAQRLLPFSLWDSQWRKSAEWERKSSVAVLLMRFNPEPLPTEPPQFLLPFSLWDSWGNYGGDEGGNE